MKCRSDSCLKVCILFRTEGSYLGFLPQLALAPTRLAGSVMALQVCNNYLMFLIGRLLLLLLLLLLLQLLLQLLLLQHMYSGGCT